MSNVTVVGHVNKVEYKEIGSNGVTIWEVSLPETNGIKGKEADNSYTIWYNFKFDGREYPENHFLLSRLKKGHVVEIVGVPDYKLDEYSYNYNSEKNSVSIKLKGVFIQWRQIGRKDSEDDTTNFDFGNNKSKTKGKPAPTADFEDQEIA